MLRRADVVALGVVQGAAELLPISSSGHVAILPWLFSRPYADADPELRKSTEVALHAGTALALLIALRGEVAGAISRLDARRAVHVAMTFLPPAVAGLALERTVEEKLGTPPTIAAGLLAGSAMLVLADRTPQKRARDDAGWVDAAWLGVAQATALVPGVSRNGATLAAARARGFRRRDANVLSRHCALPVIAGRECPEGHAAGPPRGSALGGGDPDGRRGGRLRLHAGFHQADRPRRAGPAAGVVGRVPVRPGGRGSHDRPAPRYGCARMSDPVQRTGG
jgi:undecaprenyl-diphosphatase